jgi:type VII secretion protein EccE
LPGAVAALAALAIGSAAWVRVRRRWLFEWLGVGLRYLARGRELAANAGASALLGLVAPTARVVPDALPDGSALVDDGHSLAVLLELDEPAHLRDVRALPAPAVLWSAAGRHRSLTHVQLVLSAVPAPAAGAGGGAAVTSYRQLTAGRVLAHGRAVLVIRMLRPADWSRGQLVRALSGVVRRVRRRLEPVPARPLDAPTAQRLLGDIAQYDEARPVRETWSTIRLGGLVHASFRLRRWPEKELARELVPRLLTLPATATTVAVSAGPDGGPARLTVRVAASDPITLAAAVHALHQLLATGGAEAHRLDGEQVTGLAATLPLGLDTVGPAPAGADIPDALSFGAAGLMIGVDRNGAPVTVPLFGAKATQVALVGGLRAAQLVVLRAMAMNARVTVHTVRPEAWEPFARGSGVPGDGISIVPPAGAIHDPPGTPLRPRLTVIDVGAVATRASGQPSPPPRPPLPGWHARLVVRDGLTPADVGTLSRADLVLLQQLRPDEATLAGDALGLGESAQWLTQIWPDMVAVVSRRELRWAQLAVTPVERQLIGPLVRV